MCSLTYQTLILIALATNILFCNTNKLILELKFERVTQKEKERERQAGRQTDKREKKGFEQESLV